MGVMESMMETMMNRMSQEDKAAMMDKMMAKFFEGMTKEDKQRMMQEMMPKMMEGMTMMDMMSGMMGSGENEGMMGMMSGMMGGDCNEGSMPPMAQMMGKMMPHCLEVMLPIMPKEARSELALKIVKSLIDRGTNGMSVDEKKEYLQRIAKTIQVASTSA
jgi:hypothetical protein